MLLGERLLELLEDRIWPLEMAHFDAANLAVADEQLLEVLQAAIELLAASAARTLHAPLAVATRLFERLALNLNALRDALVVRARDGRALRRRVNLRVADALRVHVRGRLLSVDAGDGLRGRGEERLDRLSRFEYFEAAIRLSSE